jgi:hypothetical protein
MGSHEIDPVLSLVDAVGTYKCVNTQHGQRVGLGRVCAVYEKEMSQKGKTRYLLKVETRELDTSEGQLDV